MVPINVHGELAIEAGYTKLAVRAHGEHVDLEFPSILAAFRFLRIARQAGYVREQPRLQNLNAFDVSLRFFVRDYLVGDAVCSTNGPKFRLRPLQLLYAAIRV